ncbi:betaine aldehyde dehydrogenase 2 [Drechmeria coniospora]|uniref:aldehyde dehydrogenase (NAD(+)) n=1 Tax=Drechmeria coniospora TaxID=98403 RepID=A0A151GQD3_DRECN|nr:betaine aldehyde dehydrogenase 2 [Drechmeria coniospora]KYK59325.1 betaine aldehyde dehydrogenase 2 [Drechmeria coniospora]
MCDTSDEVCWWAASAWAPRTERGRGRRLKATLCVQRRAEGACRRPLDLNPKLIRPRQGPFSHPPPSAVFIMSVEVITTISPTTNEAILTRNGISEADLEALPRIATEAFQKFRKTTLGERQEIVKKFLKGLLEHEGELAEELTEQMGRPIAYTGKEVATAVKRGEYLLKISDEALKDTDGEPEKGFKRFIRKVPVGPVLVIFAWNYPYLILVNSLIPAILAGNTVILKPSPQTPTIVERVAGIFSDAGLPEGVLQYFHCGSPTVMETMVRDPRIALVCFTGSVAGGLAVQKAAADRIVNVGLELGGKDPAYIRGDVDIDWVAEEIVDGAVFNSGQSCCSLERVYVDEKIHDAFVEAVQKVLKGYRLGDPSDKSTHLGPVISTRSKQMIERHIKDALDKGAKDATPDNESFANPPAKGNFVKPTLLTGVDHSMAVMTEETFGPVIPVMKVKTDAEAVKLMNDSEFGLTASIWTKDTARGFELTDEVEAGTVFVNRCDYPSPDLAWTGYKNSGKGQTLGRFGFEQFVKSKSFHVKDYPK